MLHPYHFFGSRQQESDLDYKTDSEAYRNIQGLAAQLPVTAVIRMTPAESLVFLIEFAFTVHGTMADPREVCCHVTSINFVEQMVDLKSDKT